MEIGDIYTVEMPASDGHEQAGFRPAIIVQDPRYESQLSTVLIVCADRSAHLTFSGAGFSRHISDSAYFSKWFERPIGSSGVSVACY